MTYVAAEARQQLLDDVAAAIDALAAALAALGVAYEALDEHSADALEEQLFGPVQKAYGRAKRTHAGFAERSGLPGRAFAPADPPGAAHAVSALLDRAVHGIGTADAGLSTLQDSMMPVEVGDAELRAGLAETRKLLSGLPAIARRFASRLGR
jgi:hypothetical protein